MVSSAKSAVPTVADQAAAMQLGQCAKNLATCLAELRTATQKVSFRNTVRLVQQLQDIYPSLSKVSRQADISKHRKPSLPCLMNWCNLF